MLVKHWLLPIFTAVFFILAYLPAVAEENFYYRGPKINPETTSSALFLTPIKERQENIIALDLVVEPNQAEINAVSAEIYYPSQKISFKEMSKNNSFCSFFIEEKINASEGRIKISCATPYPGTDKTSRVITLFFQGLQKGTAEINLSGESLVLANDGYGTNVLNEIKGQKILVE